MIIESLCPPAVLYLGFSLIQIIIDLFRGQQNSAFLKVIVMIIFTILLNQLCMGGLTVLSWFIVFIPFIMMTYVTTILLYVFGLNPSKGKTQPQQPDPRSRHHKAPTPYNPQEIGGCAETEFGCCPDGIIASNKYGSNCYGSGPLPAPQQYQSRGHHDYPSAPTPTPSPSPSSKPSSAPSKYSCSPLAPGMKSSCHPDMNGIYNTLAKCEQTPLCFVPKPSPSPSPSSPSVPSRHSKIGGCEVTEFGCCDDGKTARSNKYGTNCIVASNKTPVKEGFTQLYQSM